MKNKNSGRKAPFKLFIRDGAAAEKPGKSRRAGAPRMPDRAILKELARMLNVGERDIPRTLERFKKEIAELSR
jgi:hypothetical protein